jgi:hypothetical protein
MNPLMKFVVIVTPKGSSLGGTAIGMTRLNCSVGILAATTRLTVRALTMVVNAAQ